ncbi:MAG TPA: acyl-ACP--UDP-N-acetylglucosamine O-acyltransferase [Chthoniobacterales bacterium]
MKIHPTAIVEDGAVLGPEVEVGPYASIGREAVVGAGCRILAHAVLAGRVTLGERNLVGYGAVLGAPPQDLGYDETMASEVRIGDGNTFREYVTVHRGSRDGHATTVGDGNFVMVGVHIGHDGRIGDRTIIANNCLLAGHVEIGDRAVLGGGTAFHQHMRVGRLAMVCGGTRFSRDIVPFAMGDGENLLAGLNVIGMRRAGFASETRLEIKRAFRLIFRSGRNLHDALEEADGTEWGAEARELLDFVRTSKRGVCVDQPRNGSAPPDDEA